MDELKQKFSEILDTTLQYDFTGHPPEGSVYAVFATDESKERTSDALTALFAAELARVKDEAYMEGYNCTREEGQLYHQLQKAVEKNEELFVELEQKEADYQNVKEAMMKFGEEALQLREQMKNEDEVNQAIYNDLKDRNANLRGFLEQSQTNYRGALGQITDLKAELAKKDEEIAQVRGWLDIQKAYSSQKEEEIAEDFFVREAMHLADKAQLTSQLKEADEEKRALLSRISELQARNNQLEAMNNITLDNRKTS
jgi:hypothetical protein